MAGKSLHFPLALIGGLLAGALAGLIARPGAETTAAHAPLTTERGKPPLPTDHAPDPARLDLSNPVQPGRYGMLVQRVADAGSAELAALWDELAAQEEWDPAIPLIMLRWTALDHDAARAAAERYGKADIFWWAWARNEPQKALATARDSGDRNMLRAVLRAIGQTDPDRALALMDEFPDLGKSWMIRDISQGLCAEGRFREAIDQERKYGMRWDHSTLRAWAREEPEAALAWFMESMGPRSHRRGGAGRALRHHPARASRESGRPARFHAARGQAPEFSGSLGQVPRRHRP